MIYDCVVIGAGLSGLASSIILSKNGLKTALVEKAGKTGPLLRGFRRQGHYFDTGFHHAGGIAEGSSGRLMLNYLGVSNSLGIVECNPQYVDSVRFKDSSFEFSFPAGYDNIKARLYEAFPLEIHAIDEYLHEIRSQCSRLPFLNLDADFNSIKILENIRAESLNKYLSGLTDDARLKAVIGVHSLLNGVPCEEQGMGNYSYIVGPYYESVNCIEGGGSALINALEKAALDNGVDLFLEKDAEKLRFSFSGDLTGLVFKDGTALECRNIISTMHPLHILNLVSESMFRSSYVKRIKTLDETPSAYILYCKSEIDLKDMAGSSIYLLPADGMDFGDCSKPLEDRPANIIIDNSGQREGKSGQGFIVILPSLLKEVEDWKDSNRGSRPPEYLAFKEDIKRRILNHVTSFYPDLKGKIKAVDLSTPLTLKDYSGSPFGSMYGAKHKIEQYNPFPITRIPGLFLAGQSIVAPGLLGTMISAFLACGSILGHDFIRGELKRWS